jgi:hypothetical protein
LTFGRIDMGAVRPGVPDVLVRRLGEALELKAAIETGTYRGASAQVLASLFDRVWTIEWSEDLWARARDKFADNGRITCLHGSSADVLDSAIQEAATPALFWLDGHWSGGATAGATYECPVLAEITAIDASPYGADSAILVDDARLFLAPPPPPHDRDQWPPFMEVLDKLRERQERYVTVLDDVIVAVPIAARRTVEDYGTAAAAEAGTPSSLAGRMASLVASALRR